MAKRHIEKLDAVILGCRPYIFRCWLTELLAVGAIAHDAVKARRLDLRHITGRNLTGNAVVVGYFIYLHIEHRNRKARTRFTLERL